MEDYFAYLAKEVDSNAQQYDFNNLQFLEDTLAYRAAYTVKETYKLM